MGTVIGRGAFGVVIQARLLKKQPTKPPSPQQKQQQQDNDSGLDSLTYLAAAHQSSVSSASSSSSSTKKHLTTPSTTTTATTNTDLEVRMSVAVKKLPENATPKNFYDLFKELKLMFQVGQHANIVNLIGYCVEQSSLLIVTDYARYGNLKDFLRKNGKLSRSNAIGKKIGKEHLMLYSYQIALGMQYLHSKKVNLKFDKQ
jgi:serine/threonine protein kinase